MTKLYDEIAVPYPPLFKLSEQRPNKSIRGCAASSASDQGDVHKDSAESTMLLPYSMVSTVTSAETRLSYNMPLQCFVSFH